MKPCKILCIFILLMVAITHATDAFLREKRDYNLDYDEVPGEYEYEPNANRSHCLASSHDPTRFPLQRGTRCRRRLTCNKFPRTCRAKGSPGHSCCKKRCVNLLADRLNCRMCGKKCRYNEICCEGRCVNPSFHRKHCGGCNNACNKGSFCLLGLCNYV